MAISERSEMVSGVVGIPVTASTQACHRNPLLQTGLAAAVFVKVETVFTGLETGEVRFDHQAVIAVQSRHGADALADTFWTDGVEADHLGMDGNGVARDGESQREQHCQKPFHHPEQRILWPF